MMRYLTLLLLLFCTSCIQLGSEPQTMHYYLLESMPSTTAIHSSKTLNIDIEISKFPDYLDKQQIATSNQKNNISFSETNRWAEPLQDNLIFSIRENLALMLPNANIAVSPWEKSADDAFKLTLLVNRFSGKLGANSTIDIRWSVKNKGTTIITGHFIKRHPIGATYRDLVTELNRGINEFSQILAQTLAKQ